MLLYSHFLMSRSYSSNSPTNSYRFQPVDLVATNGDRIDYSHVNWKGGEVSRDFSSIPSRRATPAAFAPSTAAANLKSSPRRLRYCKDCQDRRPQKGQGYEQEHRLSQMRQSHPHCEAHERPRARHLWRDLHFLLRL